MFGEGARTANQSRGPVYARFSLGNRIVADLPHRKQSGPGATSRSDGVFGALLCKLGRIKLGVTGEARCVRPRFRMAGSGPAMSKPAWEL